MNLGNKSIIQKIECPCITCALGDQDKNRRECEECPGRIKYIERLENPGWMEDRGQTTDDPPSSRDYGAASRRRWAEKR